MNRWLTTIVFTVATMGLISAQTNAGAQQGEETKSAQSAAVLGQLLKTLDAKKLKPDDPVSVRLMQEMRGSDGTLIPAGSMVKGHVVAASARGKGDGRSSIAISFDNVVLKSGQQLPFQATIQAVGAPPFISPVEYGAGGQPTITNPGSPAPPGTLSPAGPLGGGAPVGGSPLPGGDPSQNIGNQRDSSGGGGLTTQSTGVIGLRNIELQPNSTLTSTAKDLKLASGTELILRVQSR